MTTWKAEGSGRAARAGRGPGRGAWGTLAAGCAVQGVREVVGARRARIPEPTLAGGGGGESSERLSGGARHHPPPPRTPPPRLVKVSLVELRQEREGRGRLRRSPSRSPAPLPPGRTSSSFPFSPSPAPSPLLSVPRSRYRGGAGPRNPRSKPGRPRDAAGPPELLTWGRGTRSGRGAAPPRLRALLLRFSPDSVLGAEL